jgi:hypothetical protein
LKLGFPGLGRPSTLLESFFLSRRQITPEFGFGGLAFARTLCRSASPPGGSELEAGRRLPDASDRSFSFGGKGFLAGLDASPNSGNHANLSKKRLRGHGLRR